jgi:hypothetical protein
VVGGGDGEVIVRRWLGELYRRRAARLGAEVEVWSAFGSWKLHFLR